MEEGVEDNNASDTVPWQLSQLCPSLKPPLPENTTHPDPSCILLDQTLEMTLFPLFHVMADSLGTTDLFIQTFSNQR